MNCPLCNNNTFDQCGIYLVCQGCWELLGQNELVRKATKRTKRAYCIRNFGTKNYPGE